MESSKYKIEKRNKLYFNKFRYKATARIVGVQYTYYTADIETYVNRIEKFKHSDLNYRKIHKDFDTNEYWNRINYENIEKYLIFRDTMPKDKVTSRICGDSVSFFSNDVNTFNYLRILDPNVYITEVQVLDHDKIYFKRQPKYKYRTYFKAKRMPKDFSENVITLQDMYKSIHISKGLFQSLFHNNWHPFRYMHGSYFVEYNDEQMLTILAMWFPDMLAKTYSLVKQP